MAEWLYEAGIGDERAALVEDGAIVEARIEPDGGGAKPGLICAAKIAEILPARRIACLELETGEEALLDPLPTDLTEGQTALVEIVREAIPEPGRSKRALARLAMKGREPRPARSLRDRLSAADHPLRVLPNHGPDELEAAGWSKLLEQAATGTVPFPGGALRIALTPAMTVIDVDGAAKPAELARIGAKAAGAAIRRFDIGGSTVIDLPSLSAKQDRQAAAEAFDAALPQPFERTAVNGFGLLQVVRKRQRASLLERAQYEGTAMAARALLRRIEGVAGSGKRILTAHPAVISYLKNKGEWLAMLERRVGANVELQADPALGLWHGHASAAHPG